MNQDKIISDLTRDEARRLRIYVDTKGKVTGGVGRNLTDRGFSDDEVDLMLRNDIAGAVRDLDARLPWWRQMSDARQNVLLNMCFNMGISKLLGFIKTLTYMQAGRWDAAANEMLESDWANQVGDRAKRLAATMRKGEY